MGFEAAIRGTGIKVKCEYCEATVNKTGIKDIIKLIIVEMNVIFPPLFQPVWGRMIKTCFILKKW